MLRYRQQAVFLRGDRYAIDSVRVQNAISVFSCRVNRAVNGESGGIDIIGAFHHLLAFEVHLYKAGSRNLLKKHPVGIDQEVMLGSRHASGDVREDQIVPAVESHEAVASCQIDALLPFCGSNASSYRSSGGIRGGGHKTLLGTERPS